MPKVLKSSEIYSKIDVSATYLSALGVRILCEEILKDYRRMVEDDESLPVCSFKWSDDSGFTEKQLFRQEKHVKFYGAIMKEAEAMHVYNIFIFFESDTETYCSCHKIFDGVKEIESRLYDKWYQDSSIGEAFSKLTEFKNHNII